MSVFDSIRALKALNLIDYGNIIPIHTLESLIGARIEDGWEFLGPYLEIKQVIEEEGYFLTSHGCEPRGSLRILTVPEMAYKANKIWDACKKKQKKTCHILNKADTSQLSQYQKAAHSNSILKLTLSLQKLNSVLLEVA